MGQQLQLKRKLSLAVRQWNAQSQSRPDLSQDRLTSVAMALLMALLTFVISVESRAANSLRLPAPVAATTSKVDLVDAADEDFQEKAILANQNPLQFRRFALNQVRDIEQLAADLNQQISSRPHNAAVDRQLTAAIKELQSATNIAKASLMRDTRLQTMFSRERLRSDLFNAQDAAQLALEISYDKLPAMEVASKR